MAGPISILIVLGGKWYFVYVFICISPTIGVVMCFSHVCIFSSVSCFVHFSIVWLFLINL